MCSYRMSWARCFFCGLLQRFTGVCWRSFAWEVRISAPTEKWYPTLYIEPKTWVIFYLTFYLKHDVNRYLHSFTVSYLASETHTAQKAFSKGLCEQQLVFPSFCFFSWPVCYSWLCAAFKFYKTNTVTLQHCQSYNWFLQLSTKQLMIINCLACHSMLTLKKAC